MRQPSPEKEEQTEAAQKKPWTNLFATNKMATKDMNLSYIALVVIIGETIVEILPKDTEEEDGKGKPSLVMYVVGTKPTIGAIDRFITRQAEYTKKPIILYHGDDYFVIRFANEEERDTILCSGPYHLMRRPIIMKPWTLHFISKRKSSPNSSLD